MPAKPIAALSLAEPLCYQTADYSRKKQFIELELPFVRRFMNR